MKINFNREEIKEQFFCNVLVGECFAVDLNTPNQAIYIKIWGGKSNAADLLTGEAVHFEDNEEVILLEAELKVRLGG